MGRPGRTAGESPAAAGRNRSRLTSASSAGDTPGLWTAYYLAKAAPELRIVVLEATVLRLWGLRTQWWLVERPAARPGPALRRGRRASCGRPCSDSIDEVERVTRLEAIDAQLVRGRDGERRPNPGAAAAAARSRGPRAFASRAATSTCSLLDVGELGRADTHRRSTRWQLDPALRPYSPGPTGSRLGRSRRASRRAHLRIDPGVAPSARTGRHVCERRRPRGGSAVGDPGHRGLHGAAARACGVPGCR